ncbi:MAG: GNAT family N-acetyltransferase [Saprospiraceae bacterium]
MSSQILETDRLSLHEFTLADAPFMLRLVNEPSWLQYIGDRKVYSIEDAEMYLSNGSIKSYAVNGYGFWKVVLKSTGESLGSAGLAKRDFLEDVDIGFAFLTEHTGKGYAFEIVDTILHYAMETLDIKRIVAITTKDNFRSMNLLSKLGLELEDELFLDGTNLNLFSIDHQTLDRKEIKSLVDQFFNLFTNLDGMIPHVENILQLCIPETIIIKNTSADNEIFTLASFITPRQKLLTDGSLVDFKEEETSGKTEIFGNIAQRFSHYRKSGILNGVSFKMKGAKSFQFVRTRMGWKICAVIWDDEV